MISKGKGEEKNLKRALSSVAPYVDGIYITLTAPSNELKEAEAVCKEFNAVVSYNESLWTADKKAVDWLKDFFGYDPYMKEGDKLFVFDKARNYNFSQVPKDYDYIIWIDSDDVLRGGEHLHRLAEMAEQRNIEAVYFNYIYQAEFDEKGNIKHRIIEHLRERLIRNNDHYKWIAPIHETLIEQVPTEKTDVEDCDVVHMSTDQDKINSLNRNLKNLELAIYQSEGKDPRHVYYLAKALFDQRTDEANEHAIPLILQYLTGEHKSGWPEERQQAWEYLCEIYRRRNEMNNSTKAIINAFTEPSLPTPSVFLNLALTCMMKQQYELALFWVRVATGIPEQKTTLIRNVKDIQGRTLEIIYNACLNLAKVDEAWAAGQKLLEMYPEEKSVKDAYDFIANLREQRDVTMKVSELANYLEKTGEGHKVKALVDAIPRIAEDTPFMVDLTNKVKPPKEWGDKEIAIYCGQGFTTWSPKQLSDPKNSFIGGSEEAVIKMAEALSKQGWSVTVYNDPGADEGDHDGVMYLPYYKFNKKDSFNILIAWRQIGFFDQEIKAKKSYLWAHDIQNNLEFNEDRVKRITKVMFLSKWQREGVPSLPDEKVFLTSNGI